MAFVATNDQHGNEVMRVVLSTEPGTRTIASCQNLRINCIPADIPKPEIRPGRYDHRHRFHYYADSTGSHRQDIRQLQKLHMGKRHRHESLFELNGQPSLRSSQHLERPLPEKSHSEYCKLEMPQSQKPYSRKSRSRKSSPINSQLEKWVFTHPGQSQQEKTHLENSDSEHVQPENSYSKSVFTHPEESQQENPQPENSQQVKTHLEYSDSEQCQLEKSHSKKSRSKKTHPEKSHLEKWAFTPLEKYQCERAQPKKSDSELCQPEKLQSKKYQSHVEMWLLAHLAMSQQERTQPEKSELEQSHANKSKSKKTHQENSRPEKTYQERTQPEKTQPEKPQTERPYSEKSDSKQSQPEKTQLDRPHSEEFDSELGQLGNLQSKNSQSKKALSERSHPEKSQQEKTELAKPQPEKQQEKSEVGKSDFEQCQKEKSQSKKYRSKKTHLDKSHLEMWLLTNLAKSRPMMTQSEKHQMERAHSEKIDSEQPQSEKSQLEKGVLTHPEKSQTEKIHLENSDSEQSQPEKSKTETTHPEKSQQEKTQLQKPQQKMTELEKSDFEQIQLDKSQSKKYRSKNTHRPMSHMEMWLLTNLAKSRLEKTQPEKHQMEKADLEQKQPQMSQLEKSVVSHQEKSYPEKNQPEKAQPEKTHLAPQDLEQSQTQNSQLEKSVITHPEKTQAKKFQQEKTKPERLHLEMPHSAESHSEQSQPEKLKSQKSQSKKTHMEKSQPEKSQPKKSQLEKAQPEKHQMELAQSQESDSEQSRPERYQPENACDSLDGSENLQDQLYKRHNSASASTSSPFYAWLAAKNEAAQQEALDRRSIEKLEDQCARDRTELAQMKYQSWYDSKSTLMRRSKSDMSTRPTGSSSRQSLPANEAHRRLLDWEHEKLAELKARRLEREERLMRQQLIVSTRRELSAIAWEQWVASSRNKPKPVAMGRGLDSLRATNAPHYTNPKQWQPLQPTARRNPTRAEQTAPLRTGPDYERLERLAQPRRQFWPQTMKYDCQHKGTGRAAEAKKTTEHKLKGVGNAKEKELGVSQKKELGFKGNGNQEPEKQPEGESNKKKAGERDVTLKTLPEEFQRALLGARSNSMFTEPPIWNAENAQRAREMRKVLPAAETEALECELNDEQVDQLLQQQDIQNSKVLPKKFQEKRAHLQKKLKGWLETGAPLPEPTLPDDHHNQKHQVRNELKRHQRRAVYVEELNCQREQAVQTQARRISGSRAKLAEEKLPAAPPKPGALQKRVSSIEPRLLLKCRDFKEQPKTKPWR